MNDKTIDKYILKLKNYVEKTHHKSCIIIGANPSITSKKLGKIIDHKYDYVIRINREPEKEYSEFYGTHTDIFIGFEGMLKSIQNSIIIPHKDILDISKEYISCQGKHLHTGFIAILIALGVFDVVKIFGFGFDNIQEDDNNVKFLHGTFSNDHHLINFEHQIIDKMVNQTKIFRMENYNV